MSELISEAIVPKRGSFDAAAMASGAPGLPKGFTWRCGDFTVRTVISAWKESSREGGRPTAELYLRRHCYKLLMSDDSLWTVYFLRQAPRGGNARKRWYLYSVEQADTTASAAHPDLETTGD